MTEEEVLKAIETGIQLVQQCHRDGYEILATGEMGIGNTTTSTAVAAALLDLEVEQVTGKGAGLTDEALKRKCRVIEEAIEKYSLRDADACNKWWMEDILNTQDFGKEHTLFFLILQITN